MNHTATITANYDRLVLTIECPWSPEERSVWSNHRMCKMGDEAIDCEWLAWEDGDHHPSCGQKCEDQVTVKATGALPPCWDGLEPPDECDSFDSAETGHCHPNDGCSAIQASLGSDMFWPDEPVTLATVEIKVGLDRDENLVITPNTYTQGARP